MIKKSRLLKFVVRTVSLPFRVMIALMMLIDHVARPIYRPLLDWLAQWRLMQLFEERVSRLPRSAILILFGVPFVVAEPLKLVALFELAEGRLTSGLVLLAFSYLVTFVLVERIYHAGRDKLLTYGWFAWVMAQVSWVHGHAMAFKARLLRKAGAIVRLLRRAAA